MWGTSAGVLCLIAAAVVAIGDTLGDPDMPCPIVRCAVLGNPEDLKRLDDRPWTE